jgi:hypothetical protein
VNRKPLRQQSRKDADALRIRLKRRFYKGAAIATISYVALSLIKFHGQYSDLPSELAIIWAVFLLCYTTTKEIFRWSDVGDTEIYHGELWMGVLLAGAAWMIAWNIGRIWIYHLPRIPFPSDYESATIETIVLYTLSIASSYLYKYRRHPRYTHPRAHRAAHPEPIPVVAIKKDLASAQPAQDSDNVEVILTNAPASDKENPSTKS